MAEPACLVRSFSNPSSECSREPNEANPYRALGESISFGRYMSESLSWEKWSVFSHNRYLEEVEKFSKPGSVAQMKAYFEAHYKKKAAERAATSIESANKVPSNVSKQLSVDKVCNESWVDSGLAKEERLLDEQLDKDVPDTEVVVPLHVDVHDSSDYGKVFYASKVEGEDMEIQNCTDDNNFNQIEKSELLRTSEDHLKLVVSNDEEMFDKEAAREDFLALTSKKGLKKSSPKLFNQSRACKGFLSPAKQVTSAQTRNGNVVAPRSKNYVEDSVDLKRLRTNSLHMSIHCSSKAVESNSKFSPVTQKIRNSTVCGALLNMSKNNSRMLQTGTGASNGGRKILPAKVKSGDERTKPLYQSITRGTSAERKLNPLSADQSSESLSGNGSKPRSSIKFSPFSFRSEERAAKRKEFFEKLEEKRDANKAEKKHQPTKPQGKGTRDVNRLLESSGLKTEGKQDSVSVSQLPNNHKKMPLTRPQSPKLGRKSTSSKVLDRGPQPRPSGSTKSANIEAKHKMTRKEIRSIPSHSAKNARENSSPNIQH